MKRFIFLSFWSFYFHLSYAQDSVATSSPHPMDSIATTVPQLTDSSTASSPELTDSGTVSSSQLTDSATASSSQSTDSVSHNLHVNNEPVTSISEPAYTTSFKKDGPVIIAGVGLSYLGLKLIQNKKALTEAEVLSKSENDVP